MPGEAREHAAAKVEPAPAVARLRELETRLAARARELERAHDSRCVFTHAYALMTQRIREAVHDTPDVDAAWISRLAEAFANRYFIALDANESALGAAWQRAFTAMRDKRTSVLEDLVFAMIVHIAHDLPLALGDVSPHAGPQIEHIADFHAVNDMMASSVDAIQATTARRYSPYISWLDRLGERYDELLTNYGVRMSRGLAWYNAVRLAHNRSSAHAREAIERSPVIIIDDIVRPPLWSLSVFLRFLRWNVSFLRVWPDESSDRGLTLPRG